MLKPPLKIILLFSLAFLQVISFAQDQTCSFALKEAQKQYSLGLVEKIPDMISGCLEKGFTRQERQDAFKLLIMCYLSDQATEHADSAMLAFLKRYPEYEPIPTDSREFMYLFDSYRTLPLLSIGIVGGMNTPQFFITESHSLNDLNHSSKSYKRNGINFQAGLKLNTFLTDKFEIELDILFSQVKFQTSDQFEFAGQPSELTVAIETQNRVKLPLSLVYDIYDTKKLVFYGKMGLVPSINIGSTLDATRSYINNAHNPVTGPSVTIDPMRNKYNFSGLIGAGMRYKIPHGYIFGEMQYQPGFTKQLNTEGLYSFPELRDRFFYLSDNFIVSQFGFNIGYSYSFYKPTKKK